MHLKIKSTSKLYIYLHVCIYLQGVDWLSAWIMGSKENIRLPKSTSRAMKIPHKIDFLQQLKHQYNLPAHL